MQSSHRRHTPSCCSTMYYSPPPPENGLNIEKSDETAVKYFKEAADLGDNMGKYCIALFTHTGTGLEKDETKALALFNEAAEGGLLQAQLQVRQ